MADEGNLRGAVRLVTRHTPPALINSATMPHIMKLYPQNGVGGFSLEVVHESRDQKGHLFNYPDTVSLPIFKRMKTGKASGPFANITNTIRDVAIDRRNLLHYTTSPQLAWQYLHLFACNIVPAEIQRVFASVWLALLHKEWPTSPNKPPKFRPIGPGSGCHCLVAAIVTKAERKHLASKCIQCNNLGVGAKG
eukprot:8421017-Ditylum_brightwellii.AAC.2